MNCLLVARQASMTLGAAQLALGAPGPKRTRQRRSMTKILALPTQRGAFAAGDYERRGRARDDPHPRLFRGLNLQGMRDEGA